MLSVLRQSVKRIGVSHLRIIAPVDNTASFDGRLPRWGAVSSAVFDLIGPRFEPQTYRFRDECVTARPTGRFLQQNNHVGHIVSIVFIATIVGVRKLLK